MKVLIFWYGLLLQVLFGNIAHPKLSAFVKTKNWVNISGEYLTFPSEESEFKGGVQHYLDSIEEVRILRICFCKRITTTHNIVIFLTPKTLLLHSYHPKVIHTSNLLLSLSPLALR